MKYYQHHIGDYATATKHFSLLEDGLFMRMLWTYYRDEKPLPNDLTKLAWLTGARTRKEKATMAMLLQDFFVLQEDGWHNLRADKEIAHYYKSKDKAKAGSEARWGSKKEKPDLCQDASEDMPGPSVTDATHMPDECDAYATHMQRISVGNANQQPTTNNQITDYPPLPPSGGAGREGEPTEPAKPEQCQTDATQMPEQCQTDATQMPEQCQTDATQMPEQCPGTAQTVAKPAVKKFSPAAAEPILVAKPAKFALPDWVPKSLWGEFEEVRKKRKRLLTDRARMLAVGELKKLCDAGYDVTAVMEQTILHGWDSFYPLKAQPPRASREVSHADWALAVAT